MSFKFLRYEATPGQKGYYGVATVLGWDKIILRFKMCERKDGKGTFPACAGSANVPDENGLDKFVSAFEFERNSEKDECESLIRRAIRAQNQGAQSVQNSGYVAPVQAQQSVPFIDRPEYQAAPMPDYDSIPVPEQQGLPF
jgi:hypothetical protein